ncbi:MAG: hypothetical protein PQJ61_02055 [Spirochaetales bacterium]|uniref:Uncharacterized protein n=1 Tax=Candidatus Thalassospirochaeta sargassi TaxID=3119039 RepID=A0AAJ1MML1_9SPIO|nr:hypothetical protein [Spirochaetales bacterium]
MKQKTKRSIAIFAVVTAIAIGTALLSGCFFVSLDNYTANAVNVKYDKTDAYYQGDGTDTLVGTSVSLYAYNSSTGKYFETAYMTATVGSNGSFTFYNPEPNRYKLTGTYNSSFNSDWTFVPRYIDITNSGASSKDLYAYPADEDCQYTIIASWENVDRDVDLNCTYGPETADETVPWATDYTDTTYTPEDDRYHIYFANQGDPSGVYLDNDVDTDDDSDVPRVETMSIYSNNWFNDEDYIRFYLDLYNDPDTAADDNYTLTGEDGEDPSSYAQVDLMHGDTHYGTWYVPWNTAERTLEIFYMVFDETLYNGDGGVYIYSAGYADSIKSITLE